MKRWHAALAALAFLLVSLWVGGLFIHSQVQEDAITRRAMVVSHASAVRARIESQLNAALYLSSGLSSYLVVRSRTMEDAEINAILRTMHGGNPLVRNFGIAVGYRLRYVYPVRGNESAVGLYYPDQRDQWPAIERVVREGRPVLDGPIDLVQGGRGLVYRAPIQVDGAYWGLLSTVIDIDTIFRSTLGEEGGHGEVEFAIRREPAPGRPTGPVWGDQRLFDQPGVVLQRIDVPGGGWTLAARTAADAQRPANALLLAWGVALVVGAMGSLAIHSVILNRIRLAELALYDRLTGLPNRNLLHEHAQRAFSRHERSPGAGCVVMFIDLDGFKVINDLYGHRAGDAALRVAASRATGVLRASDLLARWGGDEFVALLENTSPEQVAALRERLREVIEAPFEHDGAALRVGASIGVAAYPGDGRDLDEIVRAADHQMYLDKAARKRTP